ncbi:MAG: WGxxGxxG family protein [Sphingomicrobium sp.]
MRNRMLVALILLSAAVGPASAQNDRSGIRTETQDRLTGQDTNDILWNSIGLLGLLGLLGFRRRHGEDSYHPASLE